MRLRYWNESSFATLELPFNPGLFTIGISTLRRLQKGEPLISFLDDYVAHHVRAENMTSAGITFTNREVTDIEIYSWISLLILVIFALLLGGLPEILPCLVIAHSSKLLTSVIRSNQFDGLSSMLDPTTKEQSDPAGKSAVLGYFGNGNDEYEIGLVGIVKVE